MSTSDALVLLIPEKKWDHVKFMGSKEGDRLEKFPLFRVMGASSIFNQSFKFGFEHY